MPDPVPMVFLTRRLLVFHAAAILQQSDLARRREQLGLVMSSDMIHQLSEALQYRTVIAAQVAQIQVLDLRVASILEVRWVSHSAY